MRFIFVLFAVVILCSCNDKTVKLPETHRNDITMVRDVSPAYLFYDEETDSIEFNRKNLISTTHWLVNVDKRLTLTQVMPHIIYLQNKRKKAGMHKNENARNYFSCSNPDIQNLAFIDFTNVDYTIENIKAETHSSDFNTLNLNFKSSGTLLLNDQEINFSTLESKILETTVSKNNKSTLIFLSFQADLTFQDYINLKSKLLDIEVDRVKVSNHEIVYK